MLVYIPLFFAYIFNGIIVEKVLLNRCNILIQGNFVIGLFVKYVVPQSALIYIG